MIKEKFQYVITEYQYDDLSLSIKQYIDSLNQHHGFNIMYCITERKNVYREHLISMSFSADNQYQMGNIKRLMSKLFKK